MERKNVNYIGGSYKLVEVTYVNDEDRFSPPKKYTFKVDEALTVEKDDYVVVEASTGLGLCKVYAVYEDNLANSHISAKATAWVVDVVDFASHNHKKEATEKKAFLERKLEEHKAQMVELERFKELAESSPKAKQMYDELVELLSGEAKQIEQKGE